MAAAAAEKQRIFGNVHVLCNEFGPGTEERFGAILRATNKDEAREKIALDLIPGLVGSPIYRESSAIIASCLGKPLRAVIASPN